MIRIVTRADQMGGEITRPQTGGQSLYAYVGRSMNPTLRQPDLLEVMPYGENPIRAGDVIVCVPPGTAHGIVHRVLVVGVEGVRTRGDNNTLDDPWLLQPDDVVGQVVAARRGRGRRGISGRRMGILAAWLTRRWRWLDTLISPVLHPAYHWLANLGLASALVPSRWQPRLAVFAAPNSPHQRAERRFRLLIGHKQVGSYDPILHRWHVRRPFRLLVHPRLLRSHPKTQWPKSL